MPHPSSFFPGLPRPPFKQLSSLSPLSHLLLPLSLDFLVFSVESKDASDYCRQGERNGGGGRGKKKEGEEVPNN